jgi:hypothetical protein
MELEWPVVTVDPLLAAVRQCLDRIRQRLEAHDLACALLEIELGLEPEGSARRAVRLPAPTRDVDALVALIRLELEAHPPAAAVAAFACFVHPNKPRRGQMTLFGAPEIHPEKLAATMARIAGRIGPDRVGAPQVSDGHLPERYDTGVFDPPPAPKLRREPKNGRGLLAVRVLRPPVPLEVIVEEISCPQNKPVTLSEPTSASSGPHPPVTLSEPRRGASRRVSSGSEDHPSSQPSTGPGSDSPTRRGSFDSAASEAAPLRMTDSGTPVPFDPGPVPDPERTAERERQQSLHDKQQAPGRAGNPASSIQHPASAPPPCDELSTVDCRLSTLRLVSVTAETGATPRIQGLIRVAAGPWSLEDGWWSDRPVQRDYWDIELSGGRLYRIFRDRSSGDWFADGMYD